MRLVSGLNFVLGLREVQQLQQERQRQLSGQRLQRFGRQRALLEELHLLHVEGVGIDGGLRCADDVGEQELDAGQMAGLGVEQQHLENILKVALGDMIDQGGA